MSDEPLMIHWVKSQDGAERGYLAGEYVGVITEVTRGLLLHCLLPCWRSTETTTPHKTPEDAKAFAEHRVIESLMAEVHEARNA
jgi:hypothetical protein